MQRRDSQSTVSRMENKRQLKSNVERNIVGGALAAGPLLSKTARSGALLEAHHRRAAAIVYTSSDE